MAYDYKTIEIEFSGVTTIEDAALTAQSLADRRKCSVTFSFNGIYCCAQAGGKAERLVSDWGKIKHYMQAIANSKGESF